MKQKITIKFKHPQSYYDNLAYRIFCAGPKLSGGLRAELDAVRAESRQIEALKTKLERAARAEQLCRESTI